MTKPCDYCGRTDWGCENEAQVVACTPMPAHKPTPRQRLAARIELAGACDFFRDDDGGHRVFQGRVVISVDDARTILSALQEADRRELQATIDGDVPCG